MAKSLQGQGTSVIVGSGRSAAVLEVLIVIGEESSAERMHRLVIRIYIHISAIPVLPLLGLGHSFAA